MLLSVACKYAWPTSCSQCLAKLVDLSDLDILAQLCPAQQGVSLSLLCHKIHKANCNARQQMSALRHDYYPGGKEVMGAFATGPVRI